MNRRLLLVGAWLLAAAIGWGRYDRARTVFSNENASSPARQRADGQAGHTEIDFGGQWLFARLLVTGHGRELYHRNRQWEAARAGFPRADESAEQLDQAFPERPRVPRYKRGESVHHDADWMMFWFMGRDSPAWADAGRAMAAPFAATDPFTAAALAEASNAALTPELIEAVNAKQVGGPLYPPVHAFFYAPLGLFDRPQPALHALQVMYLLAGLLAGLGVARLSRGRVWWPVAATAVFLFPGFRSGLDLGQNSAFTLGIVVWGWVLAARGREGAGGCVWGLLAFKPSWALAFLLVPLLTRRWRFLAAMAVTGGGLVLLTLPVVGVQAWLDWLAVGKDASALYRVNRAWVFLSRDVFGLYRRFALDFDAPEADRDRPGVELVGWAVWLAVVGTTVAVTALRGDRRRSVGPPAALLFLAAYLGCYRFMYYDAVLAAAAFGVLFADPAWLPRGWGAARSVPVWVLAALVVLENALVQGEYGFVGWAVNTGVRWPWDTVILLGFWAWLARTVWRSNAPQRP